jgi:Flp pilus assembly protein TadG
MIVPGMGWRCRAKRWSAPVRVRNAGKASRRGRRWARGERGAVETTALLLIFPLLMLFFTLAVQATLVSRANQVLKFAAQEGARAARVDGGNAAAGDAKVAQIVSTLDPSIFASAPSPPYTSVQGANDTVRVQVSATVVSVVPGFNPTVTQVSEGKVERFRGPDE